MKKKKLNSYRQLDKMKLFKKIKISNLFFLSNLTFVFTILLFATFPKIDILISDFFFLNQQFISEKYTAIKSLRTYLKYLMIIFPIICLILLFCDLINRKQKVRGLLKKRTRLALLGFIVGPIIGCGVIANLYFKENWGRARPVNIQEFGGTKIFSYPFVKSDQCVRNCSWISGETSAAFSFFVGTIILRNHYFIFFNFILGFLVFFCRLSMGGHFFSDNIFAALFMLYLAFSYRYILYLGFKKKII